MTTTKTPRTWEERRALANTPGTCETVPFHIWKHNVQMLVIDYGFDGEDVMACCDRLQRWWSDGQSIGMAASSLLLMVEGRVKAGKDPSRGMGKILHNAYISRKED